MRRRFKIGVVQRVLLLGTSVFLFIYILTSTQYYILLGLTGGLIIYQVYNLIHFVEFTNRLLERFFEAIRYNDFSQSFTVSSGSKSFESLGKVLDEIIRKFQEERAKSEESVRYLETVVQHIAIGLFSFNQKGEIELLNKAAKKLLNTSVLRNIEQLKETSESLYKVVTELKSGSRTLASCTVDSKELKLAVYATEFRMKDDFYKLISLQNISSELDEKEMEAWQNLTQVLAHEMMNSITPIASLSDTVSKMLSGQIFTTESRKAIPDDTFEDVKEALGTINKRSLGLMRFVDSYRNVTQIPTPKFKILKVKEVLERIKNLMKGEASIINVKFNVDVTPVSLEITADDQLLEQALINIVKNALRAVRKTENPVINLCGAIDETGHAIIDVEDNGPGIKPAVIDKIFVPFYTTSKQNGNESGSGIGLSLSRQIMRLHSGTLTVAKSEEGCTIFRFRF